MPVDLNIYIYIHTIDYSLKIKTIKIHKNSCVIARYIYIYKLVITQYSDI